MWVYVTSGVIVLAVGGAVAYAMASPGIKRRKAVKEALDRARAEASDPADLPAQVRLARVRVQLGEDPAEALRILQAVRQKEPYHWSGEKPARMLEAEAHVALGDLPRAIAEFEAFVADVGAYDTGGDKEQKWRLDTHKVEAEQRIRLLKRGDTHVHQPEQWGDAT